MQIIMDGQLVISSLIKDWAYRAVMNRQQQSILAKATMYDPIKVNDHYKQCACYCSMWTESLTKN